MQTSRKIASSLLAQATSSTSAIAQASRCLSSNTGELLMLMIANDEVVPYGAPQWQTRNMKEYPTHPLENDVYKQSRSYHVHAYC